MDKILVAVYGSLREGQGNYLLNERAGAKLIGKGYTVDNYNLYRYGGAYFPSVSLKHNSSNKPVRVEVYETDMDGLENKYDRLEGYPHFYNRTLISIDLDSEEKDKVQRVEAYIYHIDEEQKTLVEHGDWVKYLSELGK